MAADKSSDPKTSFIIKANLDFNSSQRLTNALLNGKNYIPWAKDARTTLMGKGLLGFITGSRVRPQEGANEQEEWDIIDSQVRTLIKNSIEPNLAEEFFAQTAQELWQEIESEFVNCQNHSQIYQLKREIFQLSQENREIPEFIKLFKAKREELRTFQPATNDPKTLQERQETDEVYLFLAGLDSSYEPIRAQMLLTTGRLTLNTVMASIRQEASRRVAMSSAPKPEAQAFSAQSYPGGNGNNRAKGKGENRWCSQCKRDNHNTDRCWILHPHLKPKKFVEAGKRKTLENKAFVTAREEGATATEPKKEGEVDRLDRLEKMLSYLFS